jgi:hypothetical protein
VCIEPGQQFSSEQHAQWRKRGPREIPKRADRRLCAAQAAETYEFGDDQICQFCRGLLRGVPWPEL